MHYMWNLFYCIIIKIQKPVHNTIQSSVICTYLIYSIKVVFSAKGLGMLINKMDIYNSISCLALYRKMIKLNISKNHNNNTEIKQERKESLHALHVEFILLYTY